MVRVCSSSNNKIIRSSQNSFLSSTITQCIIFVIAIIVCLCNNKVRCISNPPKMLPRVIAGFYSYHPSYDNDQRAPIKTIYSDSSNNKYHHHHHYYYTKHQKDYGNYYQYHKWHYPENVHHLRHSNRYNPNSYYIGGHQIVSRPKYYKGKKHYNGRHKSKPRYQYIVPNALYWATFSELFDSYITLGNELQTNQSSLNYMIILSIIARNMAEFYGEKYGYPANLLYVSITLSNKLLKTLTILSILVANCQRYVQLSYLSFFLT